MRWFQNYKRKSNTYCKQLLPCHGLKVARQLLADIIATQNKFYFVTGSSMLHCYSRFTPSGVCVYVQIRFYLLGFPYLSLSRQSLVFWSKLGDILSRMMTQWSFRISINRPTFWLTAFTFWVSWEQENKIKTITLTSCKITFFKV